MQQVKIKARLGEKLMAMLLSLVLVVGFAPAVTTTQAWADDAAPFTAKVSDTAIAATDIACTTGGYSYTAYGATAPTAVDLYTVTVAKGTTEVTLDLGTKAGLAYYYGPTSNYLAAIDDSVDYLVGATQYKVKTDCNSDGTIDYVFVQNPYKADYSGGELRYVVTFVEKDATPTEETTTSNAGTYTAEKAATLIANLTARFSEGGADAGIDNAAFCAGFALHAQGLSANIDTDAVLEAMSETKAEGKLTAGAMAKYILVLNAAGLDCTSVDDNGTTRDLITEMTDLITDPTAVDVWSAVCILPAIDQAGKDTVSETTTDALLKVIEDAQDSTTGLFGGYSYFDSQTTAQAILALIPHKSDSTVASAISKAKSALLEMQVSDGGFGYNSGDTTSNLDATASIVAALAATGVDPTSVTTSDGTTPLDYLIAKADDDLEGYSDATASNEPMTASTVLMALVANLGYQEEDGAFYVYSDVIATETTPSSTATPTTTSTSSATAKTGDATAPFAAGAFVCVVGAMGALVLVRRKRD